MLRSVFAASLGALCCLSVTTAPAQAAPEAASAWVRKTFTSKGNKVDLSTRRASSNNKKFEYKFDVTPGNSGLNAVYLEWGSDGNDPDGVYWRELGTGSQRTKANETRKRHFEGSVTMRAQRFTHVKFRACYDVSLSPDVCGDSKRYEP